MDGAGAGLRPMQPDLPAGVENTVRRAERREIWFILNTNADPVMVPEPSHGTDLLTGKALAGPLDLAGYGCAVVRRS